MTLSTDVESIVGAIWESMLDAPIEVGDDCLLDEDSQLTSLVQIDGAFNGVVLTQCPQELAARLTSALLHTDTPPTADEVNDALGELANMFAGNLKALLAKPSFISLPTVMSGPYDESRFATAAMLARVPFVCEGYPFIVTILETFPTA